MSEPRWLSRDDIEILHEHAMEIGGGAVGLRDAGLLESALARPKNQYTYGEDNLFQLAACYAEGIARNHPFVDGNKRSAFLSAHQFLKDNGYLLGQSKGVKHADMMVALGQGQITRQEMGTYLAEHARGYPAD